MTWLRIGYVDKVKFTTLGAVVMLEDLTLRQQSTLHLSVSKTLEGRGNQGILSAL
jgi:hypothetical protein